MFGKYHDDGSIESDVDICVLTGRPIEAGDAIIRFRGTPYFVRVKADAVKDFTPAKRAALEGLLPTAQLVASGELQGQITEISPAGLPGVPEPESTEESKPRKRP